MSFAVNADNETVRLVPVAGRVNPVTVGLVASDLNTRAIQNREWKNRLIALLETKLLESDYYVFGQTQQVKASSAKNAVTDGINYLVDNIYSKLGYRRVISNLSTRCFRSFRQESTSVYATEPGAAFLSSQGGVAVAMYQD